MKYTPTGSLDHVVPNCEGMPEKQKADRMHIHQQMLDWNRYYPDMPFHVVEGKTYLGDIAFDRISVVNGEPLLDGRPWKMDAKEEKKPAVTLVTRPADALII